MAQSAVCSETTLWARNFFSTFETGYGRKSLRPKDDARQMTGMNAMKMSHKQMTGVAVSFGIVALIAHLVTISRYGYFRDELYYIACARHLDWGYVDLAPLSTLLLRIELALFGDSLFALRIFPALAGALAIMLTGALTRELGGHVWAIALACAGMLGSLFFLAVGNFYSLNVTTYCTYAGEQSCGYLVSSTRRTTFLASSRRSGSPRSRSSNIRKGRLSVTCG